MSSRSPQYLQGRREALKWAITWLHERAETMSDDGAWSVLNVAASEMGNAVRKGDLPAIKKRHPVRHGWKLRRTDFVPSSPTMRFCRWLKERALPQTNGERS